jgi:hypothetical protein|uniref:Uncharacterized protein n=1 Tax=Zea mays TaxID=4577 RepID=C4IYR9_MAIZE|nr:unknown [Zea mays]
MINATKCWNLTYKTSKIMMAAKMKTATIDIIDQLPWFARFRVVDVNWCSHHNHFSHDYFIVEGR